MDYVYDCVFHHEVVLVRVVIENDDGVWVVIKAGGEYVRALVNVIDGQDFENDGKVNDVRDCDDDSQEEITVVQVEIAVVLEGFGRRNNLYDRKGGRAVVVNSISDEKRL